MIFISKHIIPKGFVGLTLYPFIFLKQEHLKEDTHLINHEKIHLKQQLELFIIFFYVFYFLEWCIKLFKYKNKHLAYKNLSFEREAYQNEHNLNYLQNRKSWTFLKYL
jgi:beta-lactamase regulating signal transducer with metallopeptidase domain